MIYDFNKLYNVGRHYKIASGAATLSNSQCGSNFALNYFALYSFSSFSFNGVILGENAPVTQNILQSLALQPLAWWMSRRLNVIIKTNQMQALTWACGGFLNSLGGLPLGVQGNYKSVRPSLGV